jgi:hypothetical protein
LVPSVAERAEADGDLRQNEPGPSPKRARSRKSRAGEEDFILERIPVSTLADAVKACFAPKDWSREPSPFESPPDAADLYFQH